MFQFRARLSPPIKSPSAHSRTYLCIIPFNLPSLTFFALYVVRVQWELCSLASSFLSRTGGPPPSSFLSCPSPGRGSVERISPPRSDISSSSREGGRGEERRENLNFLSPPSLFLPLLPLSLPCSMRKIFNFSLPPAPPFLRPLSSLLVLGSAAVGRFQLRGRPAQPSYSFPLVLAKVLGIYIQRRKGTGREEEVAASAADTREARRRKSVPLRKEGSAFSPFLHFPRRPEKKRRV